MRQVNTAGIARLLAGFLIVIGTLVLPGSCKSLILAKGWPEYEGEISNLPVQQPVTMLPGLRMVIPLDDVNAMKVSMPLGQSCQPGHEHYDDLVDGWAAGELFDFPVKRPDVEAMTVSKLLLSP
jgi:hypothetical protein